MVGTDSDRAALRRAMNDRLDLDELRAACFDLGISYDSLSGDTKLARIISLLERVERRGRGGSLVDWLRANRSDCLWPDPYGVLVIESPLHLELVRVPAGEFLMGSDPIQDSEALDNEKPQHRVHLPEFFIGKYPVTVAQFNVFVETTGFETMAEKAGAGWVWQNDEWNAVKGADWQHPTGPTGATCNKAHHPVTQVSWHDAIAFCHWLSEATGRAFKLPTEAEWEKAARGTDGRLYPWGNTAPNERLCNFSYNFGDGDTTSVRDYLKGASPYGALDMAGNVWEWTGSLWGEAYDKPFFPYPYDPQDGREKPDALDTVIRVLRGGTFANTAQYLRCAARGLAYPGVPLPCFGFRVVASPSHS